MMRIVAAALACSLVAGCSAVRHTYRMDGYAPTTPAAVKQIAIRVWGPAEHPDLAPVMTQVAFDQVNQYTNYLVHSRGSMAVGWAEACAGLQGVLTLRATKVIVAPGGVVLDVTAELYRCSDGALLWRVDGSGTYPEHDVDLEKLTEAYKESLGPAAERWAAPVFGLLQELLRKLPNPPELTEEEIMLKIELEVGALLMPLGARVTS